MSKRVILITGTPCIGKTTIAKALTKKMDAHYINLTELAKHENMIAAKDKKLNTFIIDPKKMRQTLRRIIQQTEKQNIIIDGHYAASVTPKNLTTHAIVLRRNPTELRKQMNKKHYTRQKMNENLASEILDVSLFEAVRAQQPEKICEIDITQKTVKENVNTILNIINGAEPCTYGNTDWIGKLEQQGILDKYLKI